MLMDTRYHDLHFPSAGLQGCTTTSNILNRGSGDQTEILGLEGKHLTDSALPSAPKNLSSLEKKSPNVLSVLGFNTPTSMTLAIDCDPPLFFEKKW